MNRTRTTSIRATRHTPAVALALTAAATLAFVLPAQAQQQQQPQQQAETAETARTVEIKASSVYGLSNEVRKYLADAYEDLYVQPDEATDDLMIASNLLEILAASAEEAGEGKKLLQEAAAEVGIFRQRLQNKQVVTPEALSGPGAKATYAIAVAEFEEAQRALERGEESGVAYSLDSAADNLLQTHIYLKQAPADDAAKAIYNADRLAAQLKSLVEPTTQQGSEYAATWPEEKSDFESGSILAQPAAAGERPDEPTVADQIPEIAPTVMQELEAALEDARDAVNSAGEGGKSGGQK